MILEKEQLIETWDAHCKGRYPREFCALWQVVVRNICITDATILYDFVDTWEFKDVYISVYPFKKWHQTSEIRKTSARIDTLFLDFDHKEDPKIAFKEARKLVSYLIDKKGIIPRVYFSGSKGFHVYIDFPETDLFFKTECLKMAVNKLINKLKLKCVDMQVLELARVSRLPLTINTKTGYRCTPIDPKKFLEIDFDSLLHFCKYRYNQIEIHESEEFSDFLRRIDMLLITESALAEAKREVSMDDMIPNSNKKGNWKLKRIEYYAKVMREKGYLGNDPLIVKIHTKNKKIDPNDPGSIDHLARVHFVLLMIEEGFTDKQIHDIFKYAKDYNPKRTQYYIDYNRKWLEKKKTKSN